MLVAQCETGRKSKKTGGVLETKKKGLRDKHSSPEPGQDGETDDKNWSRTPFTQKQVWWQENVTVWCWGEGLLIKLLETIVGSWWWSRKELGQRHRCMNSCRIYCHWNHMLQVIQRVSRLASSPGLSFSFDFKITAIVNYQSIFLLSSIPLVIKAEEFSISTLIIDLLSIMARLISKVLPKG